MVRPKRRRGLQRCSAIWYAATASSGPAPSGPATGGGSFIGGTGGCSLFGIGIGGGGSVIGGGSEGSGGGTGGVPGGGIGCGPWTCISGQRLWPLAYPVLLEPTNSSQNEPAPFRAERPGQAGALRTRRDTGRQRCHLPKVPSVAPLDSRVSRPDREGKRGRAWEKPF